MAALRTASCNEVTKEQRDLIEQFEADYNAVDQFLRKILRKDRYESFVRLVNEYLSSHTGWRDADLLKCIGEVRNAIVHGKTEPYRYVAIPLKSLAEDLKACRGRLLNPARAIPIFSRKVETISPPDSLADVLKIIAQRDYSQFPVYQSHRFHGLLTENGITRWLAQHVAAEISLVELEEVRVEHVLQNEEKRPNHCFVASRLPVDYVRDLFASHEMLEAVLITATGKDSESLLGIATRWDILQL